MMEPAFKIVFGSAWEKLPTVFRKRYSNRSFSHDLASVEGVMDISYSKFMTWLMPIFKWMHILVPFQAKNVRVTVDFCSDPASANVSLHRKFYVSEEKPYAFNSIMHPVAENNVIEFMPFGLGWQTFYLYENNKVVMQHRRYVLRLFGVNIPMPLEIFIGKGYAEEQIIDDNAYRIEMKMTHPWFGVMYQYAGNFSFTRLPA